MRSHAISLHAKHAEYRKCPWHLAPRRQDARREADQSGIQELRKVSEQNSEAADNWNECLAPACLCRTRQTGSPAGGRVTAAGSAPVMAGTFRGSTVILGRAQSSSGQECPGYSTGFACPGWAGYVRRRPQAFVMVSLAFWASRNRLSSPRFFFACFACFVVIFPSLPLPHGRFGLHPLRLSVSAGGDFFFPTFPSFL